jgi:hypothetical protein
VMSVTDRRVRACESQVANEQVRREKIERIRIGKRVKGSRS